MVGSLVHYKCGGSKAVGVVVDTFRYECPDPQRGLTPHSLMIAIEWVVKHRFMPQPYTPRTAWHIEKGDEPYWPTDWNTKRWYPFKNFQVISEVEKQ